MTRTYFKAVRADGTDFHTGTVRWLPADGVIPAEGWVVEHPTNERVGDGASTYLSVSTVATECTGMGWPCRLLRVVPDGRQIRIPEPVKLPHKRASTRWRVTEELPAWQAFGPQGREIETLLGQIESLTEDQALAMSPDWDAARSAVRDAALGAVRAAAMSAVRDAVRDAVRYAVRGAAWEAAWEATRDAAWGDDWDAAMSAVRGAVRYAVRGAAWEAARDAAWYAVRDAARGAVRDAAWGAIRGLLVLDLEPDAAEMLLAPWVSVMGRSWEVTA